MDIESFCEDILTSPLLQDQAVELNALVDQYGNVLRSLLDLYAPRYNLVIPGINQKWLCGKTFESGERGSGVRLGYDVIVSNTLISATLSTI